VWIAVLGGVGALAIIAMVGAAVYGFMQYKAAPLADREREAMLTAAEITALVGDPPPDPSKEKFQKRRAIDRSAWYLVKNPRGEPVGNMFLVHTGRVAALYSVIGVFRPHRLREELSSGALEASVRACLRLP
jgi:hypothetical protein